MDKIASLTDKEWIDKKELGTIEEVIEYRNGEETKKVKVVAHVLSGSELEAIESVHSNFNADTFKTEVDSEGYNRAKMCAVFKIDERTLDKLLSNKSGDLRTKLLMLMNRATGAVLTEEEVESEKNSESPEP